MSDYHERFDKEFPELVSMTDGMTYRNVCDRQKVLAFIDEEISSARGKATWDGMDMGRKEERAALIEKVERFAAAGHECQCGNKIYCTQELLLSYLRDGRCKDCGAVYDEAHSRKCDLIRVEPDASQGCCEKCLDFTFQEGNMVCVDEDCPCHSPQEGCSMRGEKDHDEYCEGCHSPQGDNQTRI